jgi:hypothetical protein
MKSSKIKKILLGTVTIFSIFVAVLIIHIYWVTRPKSSDSSTIAMARIDIKEPISTKDCQQITTWLYQQKGIDHVLVNPSTQIAIFTYFPIKTKADIVVSNFKKSLPFKAERFVPTEAQMKSGCPINTNSPTYIVSKYLNQLF